MQRGLHVGVCGPTCWWWWYGRCCWACCRVRFRCQGVQRGWWVFCGVAACGWIERGCDGWNTGRVMYGWVGWVGGCMRVCSDIKNTHGHNKSALKNKQTHTLLQGHVAFCWLWALACCLLRQNPCDDGMLMCTCLCVHACVYMLVCTCSCVHARVLNTRINTYLSSTMGRHPDVPCVCDTP